MKSREVLINNASGLHALPQPFYSEGKLLQVVHRVEKDDRKVNAKSRLGVLSLGIAKGHDRYAVCGRAG